MRVVLRQQTNPFATNVNNEFDESLHPRDETGKFTFGDGGVGGGAGGFGGGGAVGGAGKVIKDPDFDDSFHVVAMPSDSGIGNVYGQRDAGEPRRYRDGKPAMSDDKSFKAYVETEYGRDIKASLSSETGKREAISVARYTGATHYKEVQGRLMSGMGKESDQINTEIGHIDNYIDKHRIKDDMTLYRGTNINGEDLQVGSKIEHKTYGSWTGSRETAQRNFAPMGKTVLMTDAKKGQKFAPAISYYNKTTDGFAFNISEKEFIMARNSNLTIKDKYYDNDDERWYVMVDVE